MSKTFDEGGAKGLLLANLGVSSNGCNIVFDSTLEDSTEESKSPEESDKSQESVNVSSLEAALETLLSGQAIEEIPLVPQLASLRSEFARLEEEGFVDHVAPVGPCIDSERFYNFTSHHCLSYAVPTICQYRRRRTRGRSIHSL